MILRFILQTLFGFGIAFADAPKTSRPCKEVVEPLARLNCYDDESKNAGLAKPLTAHRVFVEILESPAAVAAIAAALLALISGISGPLVQMTVGKRQAAAALKSADASMLTAQNAGNREIARMRLSWMDKLRDVLSDYHSILMSSEDGDLPGQAQKLSHLGTQLDLLLNLEDKIQKELWDVADKIYHSKTLDERQSYDEALIKAGRSVFKAEWEKIKAEMRGEPFQTGE
jgi:hypothetical protein